MPDDINEKEIRNRITTRYNNRSEFFGHLIAFVVFNLLLWFGLQPQDGWHTVATIFTALWGMGIAIHFVQFITTEARERAIEQAIERERQWRGVHNDDRLSRLTDDGEIEVVYEQELPQRKRKRG